MNTKEIINQLQEEKSSYEDKIKQIDTAIDAINKIGKVEIEVILTKKKKDVNKKKIPIKSVNKKNYTVGKWTPQIISFMKKNCDSFNNLELAKELKKRFDCKTNEQIVSVILSKNNIHRKKKLSKTKEICQTKKKICEHCHEKPAKSVIEGKDVCPRCFDIIKHGKPFVNQKEKGEAGYYEDDITDALEE